MRKDANLYVAGFRLKPVPKVAIKVEYFIWRAIPGENNLGLDPNNNFTGIQSQVSVAF